MSFSGLFYFFENISYPVCIGISTSHYKIETTQEGFYENSLRGKKHGVSWQNKSNTTLFETNVRISAYPDTSMNFIVTVYEQSKQFPAPSNAVVYNLDGTVHKILSTPLMKRSNDVLKEERKGQEFMSVGWEKNANGKIVLSLQVVDPRITANGHWVENQVLNLETCEFEECLHSWMW